MIEKVKEIVSVSSKEERVKELPGKIESEGEAFENQNSTLLQNLDTAEEDLQKGHDQREQAIENANEALSQMNQKKSDAEAKKNLQLGSLEDIRQSYKTAKEKYNTTAKEKMGIYKVL